MSSQSPPSFIMTPKSTSCATTNDQQLTTTGEIPHVYQLAMKPLGLLEMVSTTSKSLKLYRKAHDMLTRLLSFDYVGGPRDYKVRA